MDEIQKEKFILGASNEMYLVNGYYTFQGTQHFYFIMEYMPGGDLGSLLEE